MGERISKLERVRQTGDTQVDYQRSNILAAAEKLFLEKGLENTSMSDIAAAAGITRVSIYRYFPDIHPIAFEIAVRMLQRIASTSSGSALKSAAFQSAATGSAAADSLPSEAQSLGHIKASARAMIHSFAELREAYRYIGMFDHLYGDHYPTQRLADWYKAHLSEIAVSWGSASQEQPYRKQIVMIGNTIMSFLEKMAARGELMAGEQEVPLEDQLRLFDEMVSRYFDGLIALQENSQSKT